MGLGDEPDEQRQTPWRWRTADGNLLVYGANPLDTARVLSTLALGLAGTHPADAVHLYAVDGGAGALGPLADLRHCGAVVSGGDTSRVARLFDVLTDEIERRRALAGQHRSGERSTVDPRDRRPLVVLLVENAGAVLEALEVDGERDAPGRLLTLVRDGPALGVVTVLTVPHDRSLSSRVAGLVPQRLVLRLADSASYLSLGLVPRDLPTLGGLRGVVVGSGLEVQLAHVPDSAAMARTVSEQTAPPAQLPRAIRTLGPRMTRHELSGAHGRIDDERWSLTIGLTPSFRPVALELPPGVHALVTGPPGSGRSTALVSLAHAALGATAGDARLLIVAPRRSPLAVVGGGAVVVADSQQLDAALATVGTDPCLVLIDDVELVSAELARSLAALAEVTNDRRRLVAAGKAESLRAPGSWTMALRHGRTGVALQPAPGDGDVFRTTLPLRPSLAPAPGRGFVISLGTALQVQLVVPG